LFERPLSALFGQHVDEALDFRTLGEPKPLGFKDRDDHFLRRAYWAQRLELDGVLPPGRIKHSTILPPASSRALRQIIGQGSALPAKADVYR
jgi:hypothetical protein